MARKRKNGTGTVRLRKDDRWEGRIVIGYNENNKPITKNVLAKSKSGTGCISKINDNLFEGRYSPKVNGKRMARNVYATTREECEQKLAEMITQMKTEIVLIKQSKSA